jgi:hypothetical protein
MTKSWSAGLVQTNGRQRSFQPSMKVWMAPIRSLTLVKVPRRMACRVMIPKKIRRATRPDAESLRQEETAARYARTAIERITSPDGAGVLPVWQERHWLEPHLVAVLELPAFRLRQVAVSRASDRTLSDLRKRGRVRSSTTVPTRFHATALAYELLQQIDPWRVQTPPGVVKQGRTQTWLASAPAPKLSELAVTAGPR